MRKMIMSVAVLVLTAGLITGCGTRSRTDTPNRNTDNSYNTGTGNDRNDNYNNNNANNAMSSADFRKFRLDAEDQTAAIDRDLTAIRKRIQTENASNQNDLNDRVERIQKKNNDIKDKLDDFKDDADTKKVSDFKDKYYKDIAEIKTDVENFWTKGHGNDRMNNRDNTMNRSNDRGTNNNMRSTDNNNNNNNQTPGR